MEIFPEDKTDPTAGAKEEQYPVERTLGVMGHVRAIAKKRKWQYLQIDTTGSDVPAEIASETSRRVHEAGGEVSYIRKFYSQPETAAVTHKDGVWAVWSGEGEPTTEAFPEYAPIDQGPGSEFLKGLQARLKQTGDSEILKTSPQKLNSGPVHGTFPDDETIEINTSTAATATPKEGAVAALPVAPYRNLAAEGEAAARAAAFKRAKDNESYEMASRADQEAWAYSTNVPTGVEALNGMRARYKTREDAPIELHPNKDIAAIWLGKGEPARPAFPFVQSVPTNGHNTGHVPPTFPAPIGGSDEFHAAPMPPVPTDDLPKPVKVSGHVPSAALNEMGVKLYGMSKELLYSEKLRQYLANVSDSLHAEAARIELSKMREKLDARDRPAADQTVVRIPPPGEK